LINNLLLLVGAEACPAADFAQFAATANAKPRASRHSAGLDAGRFWVFGVSVFVGHGGKLDEARKISKFLLFRRPWKKFAMRHFFHLRRLICPVFGVNSGQEKMERYNGCRFYTRR
jgi:hypothetical protein